VALRDRAPYPGLMVSLLVRDPDVLLFGNEAVLADGAYAGYVRAGAYGHTVGGSVGLAMVERDEGVTAEWLDSAAFAVLTPSGTYPVTVSRRPLYDPGRRRILAAD
jgi:4-methylaminobutanoate oxidase (formaldehyde-forming)